MRHCLHAPLTALSVFILLVQDAIASCGPARCESGCANNATFVMWQQGVTLNSSVGEGDVIAILVNTSGSAVEVRSPCDGVVASMQDVQASETIAFRAAIAVISPAGLAAATTTTTTATTTTQPTASKVSTTAGGAETGGTGGHSTEQGHRETGTKMAPTTTTVSTSVEKVTAILRTVTDSTVAPKTVVKLGLAPNQKLEVAPVNGSFLAWMCSVGQEVKTGTPVAKLRQDRDGKEVVVEASIDGVVAAQQPALTAGDKVPAGTDLVAITEGGAVSTSPQSGAQATLLVATTLRGTERTTAEPSAAAIVAEIDNGNFAPADWATIFRQSIGRDIVPKQSEIELRSAFDGSFVGFQAVSSKKAMAGDTLALIKTDTGIVHMRAPTSGTVDVMRNLSSGDQVNKGDILLTVIADSTEASYPVDNAGSTSFVPIAVIQLLVLPLLVPPLLMCCGLALLAGRTMIREYEHRRHAAQEKVAAPEGEQLLFGGAEEDPKMPEEQMPEDADREKVQEIVDAGFTEAQARRALADADGDIDIALEALLAEDSAGSVADTEGPKIQELVEAGFSEEQARKALADAGGNMDEAFEALLAAGSTRSAPSIAMSAVADLCDTIGCTEEQARRALRNAKGDREAALNALLEGSRSSHKASELGGAAMSPPPPPMAPPPPPAKPAPQSSEEGKVAQLVDAGFAPDRARQALRDCGGNVEDAMLALLATRSESSKASKISASKLGGLSISEDDKVASLVEAGFDADTARNALRRANGDVEEALMALISD
mmetsp:Transcript_46401/g.84947  ORF Transcript_46401/g.84947 Transcript_46401/m.84947 type:complete len:774 (-) Transcript_46401:51-2372(-)